MRFPVKPGMTEAVKPGMTIVMADLIGHLSIMYFGIFFVSLQVDYARVPKRVRNPGKYNKTNEYAFQPFADRHPGPGR